MSPHHLQGTSLAPLLEDPAAEGRDAAFQVFPHRRQDSVRCSATRCARTSGATLSGETPAGPRRLRTLRSDRDPGETRAAATDRAHLETVAPHAAPPPPHLRLLDLAADLPAGHARHDFPRRWSWVGALAIGSVSVTTAADDRPGHGERPPRPRWRHHHEPEAEESPAAARARRSSSSWRAWAWARNASSLARSRTAVLEPSGGMSSSVTPIVPRRTQ